MQKKYSFRDEYAVSEVIGAVLLLIAAFIVFALIYANVFPLPLPPDEPNVHMAGYVTEDGTVVIEHMGGETLSSYEIYVDGELVYQNDNDPWEIGEINLPPINHSLVDEEDQVRVTIYTIYKDGSKPIVFDGILSGKDREETTPPTTPQESPMLISSLRTDTIDEDLICYDNGTFPDNMSTYIYKWIVNGESLAYILLPFDTENNIITKDYSGNGYNGTVIDAIWSEQGKVGGAYYFDGASDHITLDLPSFFNDIPNNDFTISLWLNSSDITDDHRVAVEVGNNDNFAVIFQFGTEIHFGVFEDGVKRAVRTENLSSNTWYHIAGVWDASEDSTTVYIDGIPSTETGYRNYPVGVQPGFDIGHGTASSRFWLGYIDEVQLYDRALSAEQIYQIYRCTKDGCLNESVIVSEETTQLNIWQCIVIPNDSTQDYDSIESNTLQIMNYSGGE